MSEAAAARTRIRERRDRLRREGALLDDSEIPWRDRQPFLASRGYALRQRYHPGWIPSWDLYSTSDARDHEDYYQLPPTYRSTLIDATRDSDGLLVCIKRVRTGGSEIEIGRYFSTPPLSNDPRNHCIPILDTFEDEADPTYSYIVMPFLNAIEEPPFEIVNDILDFAEQVLEGLSFIHEHNVAHRDAAETNILMDSRSLYPRGFHPVYKSRLPPPHYHEQTPVLPRSSATSPIRYYFADFGLSTRFSPGVPRLVTGDIGAERDVPELSATRPYDPFKLDIYVLGKVFEDQIRNKYYRTNFLAPLIAEMMQPSPEHRPTAREALQQFRHIKARMLWIQRVCRLRGQSESLLYAIIFDVLSYIKIIWLLTKRLSGWSFAWLTVLFA